MRTFLVLIAITLFNAVSFGQEDAPADVYETEFIIIEGDSVLRRSIELDEVYIFGKLSFNSEKERIRYYVLRRKTLKVYPYAKLASERLVELNSRLERVGAGGKRRQYTKMVQRYIEDEFSAELKKLTRTEGQILVKLIYRQTGMTAYDLVKELRNGWRAFWYQTTARMFDISIKQEFLPESEYEDYLIEDILQRAFAAGLLVPQKSPLKYDYAGLTNIWAGQKNME
ncbi:MAG: hypothetical protein RLZZ241_2031 [Bacteroidota bacterium]|jgi:hypothetical protein